MPKTILNTLEEALGTRFTGPQTAAGKASASRETGGTNAATGLSNTMDDDRSESTAAVVKAGEATGGAYVYQGKGAAHDGDWRVNLGKDVKSEANELGVEIPKTNWSTNQSSVVNSVKNFNDAMQVARDGKANETDSEETVTEADAFDIDVGGDVVEAADPTDYGLGGGDSAATATDMTGETSAASGIVDTAIALAESTGAAEDEAIGDYTAGTRGTIMTSAQGLLTNEADVFATENLDEDPFLRPNRNLVGGLLY